MHLNHVNYSVSIAVRETNVTSVFIILKIPTKWKKFLG